MYRVKEGEVEISIRGNLLETVEAGGVIGEMALIDSLSQSVAWCASSARHSSTATMPSPIVSQ